MENPKRWPVVYDKDELSSTISKVQASTDVSKNYYRSINGQQAEVFQGDIIELESEIPVIGETGKPAAIRAATNYWLIVGNTCDFTRDEVKWMGLSPIADATAMDDSKLRPIKEFKTSRLYYVKPWRDGVCTALVADLTQTVCISKSSLVDHAVVCARLRRESWLLFHCCLVRYLARDDGRND